MNSSKRLLFLMLILSALSESISATTIFARQYDMKCGACHVGVPPMLNKTGREFFNNGMRFSQSEPTTLQKFLSKDDDLVPIGFFLGGVKKSVDVEMQTPKGKMKKTNEIENPLITVFSSGSINKELSFFAGARFAYLKPDLEESHRELELLRSKAYVQYNHEDTFLTRVGMLYIYPDSSEMSGLSDNPDLYIAPIDRVNLKALYGFEYSHFASKNLTLTLAGGLIGDSNDENSLIAGFNYELGSLDIGAMVNRIIATDSEAEIAKYTKSELKLGERTYVMLPLEYDFNHGFLNITGVYENNKNLADEDYYALESSLNIHLFESATLRFIHTTDTEEEKAYALKYAHVLMDNFFLNTNLTKIETENATLESVSVGFNIIY